MAADVLSDLLKTVRLTGAAYFDIAAVAPWSVASPPREIILPRVLPGADHLVAYHVVTAGRCFANMPGSEPIAVEAGEIIVFTHADPHTMASAPGMCGDSPTADVLAVAAAGQQPFHLNYCGDGPSSTNLVCGYLACDARPFNPLLEALPRVIKSGISPNTEGSWLAEFIRIAVTEAGEKRAGSETVLTKISELMFIEVLRRHIEMLPADNAGWLAGLRDPSIGKVLALIHDKPAHDWVIETLAKQSGLSRSVLAERFADVVGIPPMHYLAKWRMQLASELLTSSNASVASIAEDVGYESEASFSRAFKKMIGVPPSAWRRQRV